MRGEWLWSQAERRSNLDSAPYLWALGKVFALCLSFPSVKWEWQYPSGRGYGKDDIE